MTANRKRLFFGLLFAVAGYVLLGAFRIEPHDSSDERQWATISLVHFEELFAKRTPPDASSTDAPWREGVQDSAFGANSPCLPKLVFGAALWLDGAREADPSLFPRFRFGSHWMGRRQNAAIDAHLPLLRKLVRASAAIALAFAALIASELAGPIAALVAFALLAASPMLREWAEFVRTDLPMLACSMLGLWSALVLRERLSGRRGARSLVSASAIIGALCGAVVSCKLNGAPIVAVIALWIAVVCATAKEERRVPFVRAVLAAWLVFAASAALVVYALNPVLWRDPLAESLAIVDFWSRHMDGQRARAVEASVRTAANFDQGLRLLCARLAERDDPLRTAIGLSRGWMVAVAGFGLVCALASGFVKSRSDAQRDGVRLLLLWVAFTFLATAAWVPIEWDRYFFPVLTCGALLEATLIGTFVQVCFGARRRATETQ